MSAYFIKSGNTFRVSPRENVDIHEALPAGNYVIKKDQMTGALYLEQIDNFEIRGKIYGDCLKNTDRILRTFEDRPASTGVMLTGEKGSGKTLLSKSVCLEAARRGYPTIVINAPWCGDEFNSFIQTIDQPAVILFDEFEKVYDRDDQEKMLTLLDGVFPSKKLFVLTCNDKWRVDSHMRNRPGRIYYMMDFQGLDMQFIREYCADNLKFMEHLEGICRVASMFDQFNFDMLKAMVEEINRYGESPMQVIRLLNTKPEFSGDVAYDVQIKHEGEAIAEDMVDSKVWSGNPLSPDGVSISFRVKDKTDPDDWNWENAAFETGDLQRVDGQSGTFVFSNKKTQVTLTRRAVRKFNYDAF